MTYRDMLRNLAAAMMIMMVVVGLVLAALTIDARRRGIEPPFPRPTPADKCCSQAPPSYGERGSFRRKGETGNSIPFVSPGRRG